MGVVWNKGKSCSGFPKKHLLIRIVKQELDIGTALPSMKIAVSRRDKAYKEGYGDPEDGGGKFPAPGEPNYVPPTEVVADVLLRSITAGKPGGLGEGEEF